MTVNNCLDSLIVENTSGAPPPHMPGKTNLLHIQHIHDLHVSNQVVHLPRELDKLPIPPVLALAHLILSGHLGSVCPTVGVRKPVVVFVQLQASSFIAMDGVMTGGLV